MKCSVLSAVVSLLLLHFAAAFVVPRPQHSSSSAATTASRTTTSTIPLFSFMGDKDRDKLTRDSEPEDFFVTYVILVVMVVEG